uniref:mRNA decay factor PAT1 domain-containing protein n=1 Tax=Anopheles epiroticus TaxID=199890 RepID=A0A182P1P6_9DIPT
MDSFFGFDTELPDEYGEKTLRGRRTVELHSPLQRRGKEEASDEEEYDALNDETFGAADKGDWEDIHEHLVRLESGRNRGRTGSEQDDDDGGSSVDLLFDDYDLDLQLSKLNLYYNSSNNNNNNDESGRSSVVAHSIGDEFASKLRLDPSIWGSPTKPSVFQQQQQQQYSEQRVNITPFTMPQQPSVGFRPTALTHTMGDQQLQKPSVPPGLFPPMKMFSVEDIERTIIQHQLQQNQHLQTVLQKQMAQQQQQQQYQQNQYQQFHHQQTLQGPFRPQVPSAPAPPVAAKPRDLFPPSKEAKNVQSMSMISSGASAQPVRINPALMTPPQPPTMLAARNCALFPPGPPPPATLNNPNRLPLGLLPYNMLPTRPYSTPINNLAMHPAFPQSRCTYGSPLQGFMTGGGPPPVPMGPPGLPQRHPGPPGGPFLLQRSPTPLQNNQFNQRLVQEIQQNHPMLAFNRQLVSGNGTMKVAPTNLPRAGNMKQQQQQQQQRSRVGNGVPDEQDEYANMMSNRDKQWLIGIQLTQLNADAPYFNDYYFTVYKQRLAGAKGENRIYRENQLNHPFTQPKEHAQLLLLSLLSKTGKGGSSRERRSSESRSNVAGNDGKDGTAGRAYTPLQFQNSLGKLQCGSVIAPRKLIDADVMGSDQLNGNGSGVAAAEPSVMQRKARHVLLLIETLYKIVLKLEDLFNPVAVEALKALRDKKLRERAMACERTEVNTVSVGQLEPLNGDGVPGGGNEMLEPIETYDELAAALIGQLSQDKIISILAVRKGRTMLRRSLAVLHEHPCRWMLWGMVFIALPTLPKGRDRDDADGLLLTLFGEFERQLRCGSMNEVLLVAKTIGTSRKVMQCIVSSKFLLSCIITIIFQMEMFCGKNPATLQKASEDGWWIAFLEDVNRIVKESVGTPVRSGGGNITINPDNNIVRTLVVHFARFGSRVDGSDLLNFITDNGNSASKPRTVVARKQSLQETKVTK